MLFRQLQDEKQAEKDFELLADLDPAHKDLPRFARKPRYYAAHILYALLDICGKEEILDNRKDVEENGSSKTSTEEIDGSIKTLNNEETTKPPVDDAGENADEGEGEHDEDIADSQESPASDDHLEEEPPVDSSNEDSKKK